MESLSVIRLLKWMPERDEDIFSNNVAGLFVQADSQKMNKQIASDLNIFMLYTINEIIYNALLKEKAQVNMWV